MGSAIFDATSVWALSEGHEYGILSGGGQVKTEHIQYLLMVEKCASIHKASEQLHLNHQYLSKLIMSLEREIGAKIFERTPKGVVATAEGAWILDKLHSVDETMRVIAERFRGVEQDGRRQIMGTLAFYSILNIKPKEIIETLEQFGEAFPRLKVTMQEVSAAESIRHVSEEELAVGAILYIDDLPDINPPLPEGLTFLPAYPCRFVAYVHENNDWLKNRKSISLSALAKKEMVFYSPYDAQENTTLAVLKALTEPNIKYVVSNLNSYYQLLSSGRYVSLGVLRAGSSYAPAGMRCVALKENINGTIGLIAQKQGLEHNIAVQAFTEYYLSRFR